MLQSLFYVTLHVSGVTITHLQKHKTTVTTASSNRYTVIDRLSFRKGEIAFLSSFSEGPKIKTRPQNWKT